MGTGTGAETRGRTPGGTGDESGNRDGIGDGKGDNNGEERGRGRDIWYPPNHTKGKVEDRIPQSHARGIISVDRSGCLQAVNSFWRKTRRPPGDMVPSGEQGTMNAKEETVAGTGVRAETGTSTSTGMSTSTGLVARTGVGTGTRIERKMERK